MKRRSERELDASVCIFLGVRVDESERVHMWLCTREREERERERVRDK